MSPSPTPESWKVTLDARLAQPRPDFLHSCDNCHEEVPWARCKSNKRGNEGRWYVLCKKVAGEQQTQCTFFCWASGSRGSPMPSPEIPQESPQLHPLAMPATLSDTTLLFICAALPSKAPGRCYATQMPALFTQQNAIEESIQEEEQQRDHERLQAVQCAKNNIIIYAWIKDGTEPIIYEFQEGFMFPNFFFSHDVLCKLEILSEDTAQVPPMQRYNCVLDTWTCFDVGHMVTLHDRDGGALLVKNACVKDCIDLGHHIQKLTHPSSPNIVKALPAERKYMRAVSHAKSSRPPSPSIDPSMHDHVGPVPTIHDSQQNRGGSVLLLTDSEGTGTATQLNCGSSILSLIDSEEETPATAHPLKRCASPSDSLSPRPLLRLRRYPSAKWSFQFSASSKTSSQSRSSSPLSIQFTGPIIKEESSGNLLSYGTLKADAIEVEEVAIWPVDFYVINIANGFNLCKKAADSRHKVSQVFIKHFGMPFKASTYYNNRKVSDLEVNRVLRERFTDYGHTEKGRWTAFMKKAQWPAK
ncbi:hypothetical protein BDR03DRAFT_1010659 [Suillus americanus]|nr:hypothetical protein BDR03DRAFT_1010659 [Suillus americanus]